MDVKLRPIAISDSKVIFNVIDSHRSYLRKWLTFIDTSKNESSTINYIESTRSYNKNGDVVFVINFEGKIAGLIGYEAINIYRRKAELGYWIFPQYEGRGIMSSAVKEMLYLGFIEYKFNRIEIKCALKNIRSASIATKFNFKLEGIERDGELLSSGVYTDVLVYSLLYREYALMDL